MDKNKSSNVNQADELVTVELFKDNGKYKDPLLVCVNGENCMIQRGVPVQIKRKFIWAIEQSQFQDKQTAQMIEREASAFADAERRLAR